MPNSIFTTSRVGVSTVCPADHDARRHPRFELVQGTRPVFLEEPGRGAVGQKPAAGLVWQPGHYFASFSA